MKIINVTRELLLTSLTGGTSRWHGGWSAANIIYSYYEKFVFGIRTQSANNIEHSDNSADLAECLMEQKKKCLCKLEGKVEEIYNNILKSNEYVYKRFQSLVRTCHVFIVCIPFILISSGICMKLSSFFAYIMTFISALYCKARVNLRIIFSKFMNHVNKRYYN